MAKNHHGRVTGHLRLRRGKNGATWYLRYRLPDGTQRQRRLGWAWEQDGRPPDGYYTKRTAKEALRETLVKAARGELPGQRKTGATFADASAEFLRFCQQERKIDDDTIADYRGVIAGYLDREFGDRPLEEIDADDIDDYKGRLLAGGRLSNRTICRHLVVCHGVFARAGRVWKLKTNPAAAKLVARPPVVYTGEYQAYEPDEVELLARTAARANRQDGALIRVAAYTGGRLGELLALTWADVDFVTGLVHVRRNYTGKPPRVKIPKGKKVRSVPMAPPVVDELARLKERDQFTGDGDLVFATALGGHLDAWQFRRRYYRATKAAGLRRLVFHDLRHTFGTHVVRELDLYTLQSLMGHQNHATTERYLHHKPRPSDAAAIARAFGNGGKPGGEPAETPDAEREARGL
jgi:integrase